MLGQVNSKCTICEALKHEPWFMARSHKHQASSDEPQASSLTRALGWDIIGSRVTSEMVWQSIYVKVHLWARAIAPPRSCSYEAATIGKKKFPHALGTGAAGLWFQIPAPQSSYEPKPQASSQSSKHQAASFKPQAASLKAIATSNKLQDSRA